MYHIYTIIDNDLPERKVVSKVTSNKNMALCDAASALKTTNIRIINDRELNDFERWAHFKKNMLIDIDEKGQYKSLETRAYADTWQEARVTPNYIVKSLLQAHKSDRRINRKLKTDIRKDFDVINSDAQAEKYLYQG